MLLASDYMQLPISAVAALVIAWVGLFTLPLFFFRLTSHGHMMYAPLKGRAKKKIDVSKPR